MTRTAFTEVCKESIGGAIFTVDGSGNITPTPSRPSIEGRRSVTQADTSCQHDVSGHVCARQSNVCQCSTLVRRRVQRQSHGDRDGVHGQVGRGGERHVRDLRGHGFGGNGPNASNGTSSSGRPDLAKRIARVASRRDSSRPQRAAGPALPGSPRPC